MDYALEQISTLNMTNADKSRMLKLQTFIYRYCLGKCMKEIATTYATMELVAIAQQKGMKNPTHAWRKVTHNEYKLLSN